MAHSATHLVQGRNRAVAKRRTGKKGHATERLPGQLYITAHMVWHDEYSATLPLDTYIHLCIGR